MALHASTAPWHVPDTAVTDFNWFMWASPPIHVTGEPPDVALDIRIHVHIQNILPGTVGNMWIQIPNEEYMRLGNLSEQYERDEEDGNGLVELGSEATPFVFKDREPHYFDRFGFYRLYDPATESFTEFDFRQPLDGTVMFRADEEMWSIGLHSAINGAYKFIITDNGSENHSGLPLMIPYWAMEFRNPDVIDGGGGGGGSGTNPVASSTQVGGRVTGVVN